MLSPISPLEHFLTTGNADLQDYCIGLPSLREIGAEIKLLSASILAKIGPNVTQAEYAHQQHAWQVLNRGCLRVPKPYRFFVFANNEYGERCGYFLMEYLAGTELNPRLPEHVSRASAAIKCVHRLSKVVTHVRPGPVSGGQAESFPWNGYEAETSFHTVQDIENCLNRRSRGRLWRFPSGTQG